MPKVQDYMSKELITLTDSLCVYHAFITMELYHIRHIPIVDTKGHLCGIVSDRDLKKQIHEAFDQEKKSFSNQSFMHTTLSKAMTPSPHTVNPDTPLHQAVSTMLAHKISSLVVLSPETQKPIGIITDTDMLKLLSETLQP